MNNNDIIIKMLSDRWKGAIKNFDQRLAALSDTDLLREIAPGKNRGLYIIGHLIAVHDDMLILLDMGEKIYPALHEPFLQRPDKAIADLPSPSELRSLWAKQCSILEEKFSKLSAADWFEKHSAVSAADFVNEPHRNKLNILLTRTTHLTYHTGQLALLLK
jgi:hypothetical protein